MDLLNQLSEKLQAGDADQTAALTQQAIGQQIAAKQILDQGLIAGMAVVGDKFKAHEIFLPDVLLAAKAMYAGLDLLKPLLAKAGVPTFGKVVVGTVQGDLHDIGKNLVAIMLKGAGLDVIDLGKDVAPEKFVAAVKQHDAQVIGMSALLTTTMPVMKQVVEQVRAAGLYGQVKIIVGGAPLSNEYAKEIGADAYCFDGVNAVDVVKRYVGSR